MNKKIAISVVIVALVIVGGYFAVTKNFFKPTNEQVNNNEATPVAKYAGKKLLYINSYHQGYAWSDDVQNSALAILKDTGIEVQNFYLDTKNHPTPEWAKAKALEAKALIEKFKPDVVIESDDDSYKYIVMPYYKDTKLPFVSVGVNWNFDNYGGRYSNVAGMLELDLLEGNVNLMKQYAKGNRIGMIGPDVTSEQKNATFYSNFFKNNMAISEPLNIKLVKTFAEWKKAYLELQDSVDMVFIQSFPGIEGWDSNEAENFIRTNTKIPSAVTQVAMTPFSLIGLTKRSAEFGEYAAKTAMQILDGSKPSDIPSTMNKEGDLILNLKIAKKLNITFTPALIRTAKSIINEQ